MEIRNISSEVKFFLVGFSDFPKHRVLLVAIFLIVYILTLGGNTSIITIVRVNSSLHKPMYFFLGNLSFVDICLISCTVPKLLINLIFNQTTISHSECIGQMSLLLTVGSAEFFLLAVMAYDRYVAICCPLHYTMIMRRKVCIILVIMCWLCANLHSLLHTVMMNQLFFCGDVVINHFFCDLPPLLKLSCSDNFAHEIVIFTEGPLVVMGPFIFTLVSYIHIISTILKIPSATERGKAFSTCSSHLTVVTLFYVTDIFIYFRPVSSSSLEYNRIISVMYTVIAPMLNPFIYTLRNSEVKGALRKAFKRKTAA
ncbi:olfactory receptor 1F1-like [Ambystoma mexicanum]|uniref:olfactory receptor 1F1-like n=1 Tax=Ambystoma mexicanum TaxID=8296 RepID=UPI0037E9751C